MTSDESFRETLRIAASRVEGLQKKPHPGYPPPPPDPTPEQMRPGQPEFERVEGGSDAVLLCPGCGGDYLHHDRVEVFERKEDAETGLRVVVSAETVQADSDISANPSWRRHGFVIHFFCEHCQGWSSLSFAQHKGQTIVWGQREKAPDGGMRRKGL